MTPRCAAIRRASRPHSLPRTTAAALMLLALALVTAPMHAQAIDKERSRFLSEPHGRPGTCAPYRLAFKATADTERVEVIHGNVKLTMDVAAKPGQTSETILPVYVAPGVVIRVAGDEHTPRLPMRRIEPDYEQPYVAVFAADAMYARPILPGVPGQLACDYYENREFFSDWRLFDGYDGLVLFSPEAQRPPAGTQRAIAEFCSMGGAAIIIGSFRMGEKVEGLPAPAEAELLKFHGVSAQRMAYGPGAIYRIDFEELRRSGNPYAVLRGALLDHLWYGDAPAPAGKPQSRVPSPAALNVVAGTPEAPQPGALFFGLAGALLALCGVLPLIARRVKFGALWAMPAVAAGALSIGAIAMLQPQPRPLLDCWAVVYAESQDRQRPASARAFLLPGQDIDETLAVDMAGPARALPRPWRSALGKAGWQLDLPLQTGDPADLADLVLGEVNGTRFRDFAALAHKGEAGFDAESARLLEWWLDENAYSGRRSGLGAASWQLAAEGATGLDSVEKRTRGALWVVNRRMVTDPR